MPSIPTKTQRRSHWLTTAILVLVVFIVGGWWLTRATLDSRFVGTWTWYATSNKTPGTSNATNRVATLILRSDGSGRAISAVDSSELEQLEWRINGRGHFVLAVQSDLLERLRMVTAGVRAPFTGEADPGEHDRWHVRELAEDKIILEDVDDPGSLMILERVSATKSAR